MRVRLLATLISLAAGTGLPGLAAQTPSATTTPSILGPKLQAAPSVVAEGIPGVIAPGTPVPLIKDGLPGADGIVGLPDGTAAFVEQNSPRITRINADDSLSTILEAPGTRALGVDSKGRLIALVLSAGTSKADHLRVLTGEGAGTVLATEVEGKRLFQGNDFVISRRDEVFMTDAGTLMKPAYEEPTHLYRIPLAPGGGAPRKAADAAARIIMPNGIALSPDDRTLYVNDSRGESLVAFDVKADGSLANRRDFAKYRISEESKKTFPYQADGLAVDRAGNVFVAMPLGVDVFNAKGAFLGRIPLSKKMQNLAFAGPDRKTLYMVSQGSIWKVRTLTGGPTDRAK
jgi:gluconolactonase